MRQFSHPIATLVLAFALAVPSVCLADSSAEGFVKEKHAQLVSLVEQKADGHAKQIERTFDEMLDYEELARASLRDHWQGRSPEERQEFQSILKELVKRAYRKNLSKTADYEVDYVREAKRDTGFLVKTVARSKTNVREEPVEIEYLVRRVGGKWRVHDIVTEGSSLVGNYHRQFIRIIKKDGFDELMRRMKTKLDKG